MALPKLDTPTYELTLPLCKKKVKFRPFNVKEQRNLLMAMESEDTKEIQDSVENILDNCTLTEGIEVGKLPIVDVEYYFINLRAKSVGEVVENNYICNNEIDGNRCNNKMKVVIDLNDIQIDGYKPDDSLIQLTNTISKIGRAHV